MGIYRQISLEPLYFIRDFNKWSPDIDFDYVTVDTSRPCRTTRQKLTNASTRTLHDKLIDNLSQVLSVASVNVKQYH